MSQTLAVAALLLCACASVFAHTGLTDGPSKAPSYSTWQKALTIPSNKVSLSARRIDNCKDNSPYFWLKYTGKRGDVLGVEAGTYKAVGLNNVRISAVIFGPGLPAIKRKLAFKHPAGGARVVVGAKDVSTCKFLPKEKFDGQTINTIGGQKRCGTLVPGVATSYFPLLSHKFTLPQAATYYIVYFTQGQYDGRWYIGTGAWGHVHAEVKLPPPPKGNTGLNATQFWNLGVKSNCCVKGVSVAKCPARKVFA